jgi:hypothetical protein
MPSFALLGTADLTQIANFLVASKGDIKTSGK